jgi:hypothetical protein
VLANAPLKDPTGVRVADAITISTMTGSFFTDRRRLTGNAFR